MTGDVFVPKNSIRFFALNVVCAVFVGCLWGFYTYF